MRKMCLVLALMTVLMSEFSLTSCKREEFRDFYYYAVVNESYITAEDAAAIDRLLAAWSEHDVFVIDTSDCETAEQVYEKLSVDMKTRKGTLAGIQIFGTAHMVPAFFVDDTTLWADGVTTDDAYLTDYFYGNFANDASVLRDFNVADAFASDATVDLVPRWPVARLALAAGEFSDYVENYGTYQASDMPLRTVGLAAPIFRFNAVAVDDMAHFLNRAVTEWKMLDGAHLYANNQGEFPSSVGIVLGDISTEALHKENTEAVCEIYFGGHGDPNRLFRTVFEEGQSATHVFMDEDILQNTLSKNPYYLNLWSCGNADGLDYNLVHTALQNGCLGAFAATSEFNNNGVNCAETVEQMADNGNFYYFYYCYLAARHGGRTRSTAFFDAQVKYATALAAYAQKPINYGANYQCAYNNLLAYANVGILEPDNTIPDSAEKRLNGEGQKMFGEFLTVSGGNVSGGSRTLSASSMTQNGVTVATVYGVTAWELDNGYTRFVCKTDVKTDARCGILIGYHEQVEHLYSLTENNRLYLIFDVKNDRMTDGWLTLFFRAADDQSSYILWKINGID